MNTLNSNIFQITSIGSNKLKPLLCICLIVLMSCEKTPKGPEPLFEAMSSRHTQVDFRNRVPVDPLTNSFVYEYVYNGGGVAVGDLNNDGLEDLYFSSNLESNALYLNTGDLKFKDITKASNSAGKRGWTTGVSMIDINNDGLLDIYICKSGPYEKVTLLENELLINKGVNKDGIPVFEEAAKSFGLNDTSNSIQAAFLDYDLDGDLDMFLMNHNPQTFGRGGRENFSPYGDKFYENRDGKFVEVTKEVGIYSNDVSYGLGIGVSDLNLDGWPDVYISNDYDEPDYMYINQKNGQFKEIIKKATNHTANFSMGNDIADFNNDGFVDILTLDMVSEDNYGMKTSMASMNPEKFQQNVDAGNHYQYMYNTFHKHSTHIDKDGDPFFSDVAQITGMANTDWSWAPLMADFDNDGLKDVFITNGIKKDFRNKDFFNYLQDYRKKNSDWLGDPKKIMSLLDKTPARPQQNYFYKNEGGISFKNTSNIWLEDNVKSFSNGAAYADLDNDGDLDLVVNNMDDKAMILKNNADANDMNYLDLVFNGSEKNTKGLGVKAMVYQNGKQQLYENYSVRGYQSSVPTKLHVGLGKNPKIDSLVIIWPDKKRQKINSPEVNNIRQINYTDAQAVENQNNEKIKRLFTTSAKLADLNHLENNFNDYAKQVLMPHKMSQFGPGIAVGDINNDGREDVYFGQSTGKSSAMYTQMKSGEFKLHQTFAQDSIFEDIDAKFVDFDKDGDLDLYVASGGNEFSINSPNYADRLYENVNGNFKKRNDLLPTNVFISSGKIRVEDFDNDGYPDIFVGGRLVPHAYPAPASSYILHNQNGKYIDITDEKAPGLKELGLVTDATWTDFDNDGDVDLCVVGEWMTPTFFENNNNSFAKREIPALDALNGWYYAIKSVDLDNDGDDDYIVGNLGTNYKYQATYEEPFEVYYDDFDDNGKADIVLGYYNFGELFPVRGKECSTQQVGAIKDIAPTYDDFGKSSLVDLYDKRKLDASLHLSSYSFKSGVLKNNGNGEFEFIAFPDLAQLSSINDILIKDLDNDGNQDLIVAGNLFTSEIETPRNDASYGMVLLNKGNFKLEALDANKSGLFAAKDVKNLNFIKIQNNVHVLVGNNGDKPSVFELNLKNN